MDSKAPDTATIHGGEPPPGELGFINKVFPAEIETIAKRRDAAGIAQPDDPVKKTTAGSGGVVPDADLGLVGLAFSGGGIRSATLNLGVLQVFAKRGLLRWFDYLSTVSGGGYIGSALSAALRSEHEHDKEFGASFEHKQGKDEPELIKHLRSGRDYLAPGGLLDYMRIPAVLLRGIVVNLLVITPLIGILALLTAGIYPDLPDRADETPFFILTPWVAATFLAWAAAFPFVSFFFPRARFKTRSRFELSFGAALLLIFLVLLIESGPWIYYEIFLVFPEIDWEHLIVSVTAALAAIVPLVRSLGSQEQGASPLALLLGRLKAAAVLLLGPLIVLGIYLLLTRLLLGPPRTTGQEADADFLELVYRRMMLMLVILATVWLYDRLFVNINTTGLHRFYRDRLSKAYLFDPVCKKHLDRLLLSDLDPEVTGAPYHLINTALNIPATQERDLQGRWADFFVFSPKWCGSYQTGYCRTKQLEFWDPALDVATAFSVSGAAAAPYMGTSRSPMLAFMLTVMNVRLDYWITNPASIPAEDGRQGFFSRLIRYIWANQVGPIYLLRELVGKLDAHSRFVNLSDGGHIENLALYELLRRRCKYIVVCDAEMDPELIFSSLGKITGYARMDQGVWIEWKNVRRIREDPETGLSRAQWATGEIDYGGGKTGHILYMKSSFQGDEPADLQTYRAKNPEFPHQSTTDQFFDEAQFESYRALGYHIASRFFEDGTNVPDFAAWFDKVLEASEKVDEETRRTGGLDVEELAASASA